MKGVAVPGFRPGALGLGHFLRRLAKSGPVSERRQTESLAVRIDWLTKYAERKTPIEEAIEKLQASQSEYDQLAQDEEAWLKRAEALFSEERFLPCRFTAREVRETVEALGGLPSPNDSEQSFARLSAAILRLADPGRRAVLAMALMLEIPELVAAGRAMDACLALELSGVMLEETETGNAFLFTMFGFGYDEWMAERTAVDESCLREIGVDVEQLRGMTPAELETWLDAQQADAEMQSRIGKVLDRHPGSRDRSAAQMEEWDRQSLALLGRPESRDLLIPEAELEPWLARFVDQLNRTARERMEQGESGAGVPQGNALVEAVRPLVEEVATTYFDAERRRVLLRKLRECRDRFHAAGEKSLWQSAQGAILGVELETGSMPSTFLSALSLASLIDATRSLGDDPGVGG